MEAIWVVLRIAATIALFAVGYALLVNRLVAATSGLRGMLADRGERLLLSGRLSTRKQRSVTLMLDNALNGWAMVILAFLVPIAAVMTFLGIGPKPELDKDADAEVQVGLIGVLFAGVNGATNPLFSLIVFAEIVIFALFMTAGRKWVDFAARLNLLSSRMISANPKHA